MTQSEIIEGNKLISEFTGLTLNKKQFPLTPFYEKDKTFLAYEPDLQFHQSWNWLMPVVEKIGKEYTINLHSFPGNGFDFVVKEGNFRRGFGENENPIIATFQAIIEFIKWYNENK